VNIVVLWLLSPGMIFDPGVCPPPPLAKESVGIHISDRSARRLDVLYTVIEQ